MLRGFFFPIFCLLMVFFVVGCQQGSSFKGSGVVEKAQEPDPPGTPSKCKENCGSKEPPQQCLTSLASCDLNEEVLFDTSSEEPHTDKFSLQKTNSKVKLIWVLDNSGSMKQEAEHIKNNISSFLGFVEQRSQIEMALISKDHSETGFNLPEELTTKGHLQVSEPVASTNALYLASRALLSDSSEILSPDSFKNKVANSELSKKLSSLQKYSSKSNIGESLKGFYEKDTRNVLVVVTDDETMLDSGTFLNVIDSISPTENFKFYGFIGLEKGTRTSDCAIAREGKEYKALASITGGNVFDICAKEWQTHFQNLADSIVKLAFSDFELTKKEIMQVKEVRIDGRVIDPEKYQFKGKKILLEPEVVDLENDETIEVEYTYLKQKA